MQIVEPIDVEDALRVEIAAAIDDIVACAPPAPDDLAPGTVCVTRLGGGPQSAVSHEHDVSVDVWAETPAAAMALADRVQGVVASLPLREGASGATWTTSDPMLPYPNPDPHRPTIPRATFRATVGARGVPIDL